MATAKKKPVQDTEQITVNVNIRDARQFASDFDQDMYPLNDEGEVDEADFAECWAAWWPQAQPVLTVAKRFCDTDAAIQCINKLLEFGDAK